MPHEVIMPALGMAQDTGKLVSWLKAAGDTVTADEPLMEVETDKSVMEVPAGADGTLGDLRAEPGDDVPVGQVVAVIFAAGEDAGATAAPAPVADKAPEPEREPEAAHEPAPAPQVAEAPAVAPMSPTGKVLASPKAKRLAAERGIDLAALVAAGVPEPLHAADLDRAETLPAVAARPAPGGGGTLNFAAASCERAAFDEFLSRMAEQVSVVLEPHVLAAGFAASALRPYFDGQAIAIAVEAGPALRRVVYADPDLTRPSRPRFAPEGTVPDLILRDLTWGRVTALALAEDDAPALTLGASGDRFALSLAYPADMLSLDAAVHLLSGMAERLENPMENLV